MSQAELFQNWCIPFVMFGRECVVPRASAVDVIKQIYGNGYIFLGYDAFTVFPDGKRQPITEFCAAFSAENQPSINAAKDALKNDPLQVTHYVFVFKPSA